MRENDITAWMYIDEIPRKMVKLTCCDSERNMLSIPQLHTLEFFKKIPDRKSSLLKLNY